MSKIFPSLLLCGLIVGTCLALIILLDGFRYEYKKFRQFLITFIFVMLLKYAILQHIGIFIQSLILTVWKKRQVHNEEKQQQRIFDYQYNPLAYLKLQLKSLKANFDLPPKHRNEALNFEYKFLSKELWLYCKYYSLILFLILFTRSPYGYYNTNMVRMAIMENRLSEFSLTTNLTVIEDLYDFINATIIEPFNQGRYYNDELIKEPGWLQFQLSKLMGVVRLQQIRLKQKNKGMQDISFDCASYLPGWQPYNRTLYYVDKYWRTYGPWLCKEYGEIANWLMTPKYVGRSLYTYTENGGYVATLARNRHNSLKILEFLKKHKWLDKKTLAVFIDFTLYNVDSNIFSISSFMAEQTPFGNVIYQFSVDSVTLLSNMNNLSLKLWLLLTLYALVFLDFCSTVVLKLWWYLPEFFKSPWNCIDLLIVLNNFIVLTLFLLRERSVTEVLEQFQSSKKLDFVDFRVAAHLDYITNMAMGFLVALTTLRLWKILQFSSIFSLFTRTLYTSGWALLSTLIGIMIFLLGISMAIQIVNGSYTENFARLLRSLISIMSFSFGFHQQTSSSDLQHGGGVLGFLLYVILMFVVSIFMINMFITLICDHFCAARKLRDSQLQERQISYWKFLREEFAWLLAYIGDPVIAVVKSKQKMSVSNRIKQSKEEFSKTSEFETVDPAQNPTYEENFAKSNRLRLVNNILEMQTEILYREIVSLEFLDDSSNESD